MIRAEIETRKFSYTTMILSTMLHITVSTSFSLLGWNFKKIINLINATFAITLITCNKSSSQFPAFYYKLSEITTEWAVLLTTEITTEWSTPFISTAIFAIYSQADTDYVS